MRATTNVARTATRVAAWVVALACAATSAAAQDTTLGFAVGVGVPATGIGLQAPALSVSGWLARPADDQNLFRFAGSEKLFSGGDELRAALVPLCAAH